MKKNAVITSSYKRKALFISGFIMTLFITSLIDVGLSSAQSPDQPFKSKKKTIVSDSLVVKDLTIINPNPIHKVRATFYNPTVGQTDGSPNRTATGFEIDMSNPFKHRIIAISPDLERMGYEMGDSVNICICNKDKALHYNGNYIIQDRMPSQHVRKIDFLVSSNMYMTYLKEVEIQKLN